MNLYEKARHLAVQAHESIGQTRKYSKRPYYTHVLEVAELVSKVTNDEDVLAAACLHDVLEDVAPVNPSFNEDWILREFNQRVLNIVVELTNVYTKEAYPQFNRKARKVLEHERLAKVSDEAKLVKRADLHHNSTEMDEQDGFTKVWLEEKKHLETILGGAWSGVV